MIGKRTQNVQSVTSAQLHRVRKPLQDLSNNLSRGINVLPDKIGKVQPKEDAKLKKAVVFEPIGRRLKHGIKQASKSKTQEASIGQKQTLNVKHVNGTNNASSEAAKRVDLLRLERAFAARDSRTNRVVEKSSDYTKGEDELAKTIHSFPKNKSLGAECAVAAHDSLTKLLSEMGISNTKNDDWPADAKPISPKNQSPPKPIALESELTLSQPSGEKENKPSLLDAAAPECQEIRNVYHRCHSEEAAIAPLLPPSTEHRASVDQVVPSQQCDVPPIRGRKILGRRMSPILATPVYETQRRRRQRSHQASSGNFAGLLDDRDDELHRYLKQQELRRHKAVMAMVLEQKRKTSRSSSCSQSMDQSMDQSASMPINLLPSRPKNVIPPYPHGGMNQMVRYGCHQEYDLLGQRGCQGWQMPTNGLASQSVAARIRYEPKDLLQLNYRKQSPGQNMKNDTKSPKGF